MKLHRASSNVLAFRCPGCGHAHRVRLDTWTWNGSMDQPTFEPSILTSDPAPFVCHSFVRDGRIRFLNDCTHELKGKTVELPDWNCSDLKEKS